SPEPLGVVRPVDIRPEEAENRPPVARTWGRVVDWRAQLIDQLDWHWQNQLRPRLDGLTDDEYLWEPVQGCWSIRPRGEAVSADPRGAGDYVIDWEHPAPDPSPVTTIAWRIGHISIPVLGARAANHFGRGGVSAATTDWSPRAVDGLALLDHHYDQWTQGLRSLSLEGLEAPCGPAEGPFASEPFAALVLHINREVIHHGAEVALLRDLYRAEFGD
ncbi:MAG TPA: DinB family protein, partial [Longimicrobiales bacterium]|nr:DinB family protein [Longimicrobiales bacterium]